MLKPILDVIKKPEIEGGLEPLVADAMVAISKELEIPSGWKGKALEFTVRFSDDDEVQSLNKQFRGKDKPTNVLSFPAGDDMPGMEMLPEKYIGDIIVSCDTLAREAKEQNKSLNDHLSHLLVHSVLHLFGYDHIEDDEAEEMESLEVVILKHLEISDPYHK